MRADDGDSPTTTSNSADDLRQIPRTDYATDHVKRHALRLPSIKAFLAYACAEDLTLVALSQAATTLKAPPGPKKPIEYLSDLETKAVPGAFTGSTTKSRRNRMLLILLYDTAARVGEITSLTLGDMADSTGRRNTLMMEVFGGVDRH